MKFINSLDDNFICLVVECESGQVINIVSVIIVTVLKTLLLIV